MALDTIILARAIAAQTDADAATRAQRKRAQALQPSGQPLFVPVTAIEEIERVLRGACDMPLDDIAAVFEDMLAVENPTVDRAAAIRQALARRRQGPGFSDALHLAQSGLDAGLATFDVRFARTARRLGLEPRPSRTRADAP